MKSLKKKMKNLKEIQKILAAHKEEMQKRYNLKEIGIFGSFARGEQNKTSDIDILVEFQEVPDLLRFIELERYFEDLLKMKVDLVRKFSVRSELKDIILREVVEV
ncbi:MAG: nucleotidyltransferase family protein [Candidatus Omnitrophota bacterium]